MSYLTIDPQVNGDSVKIRVLMKRSSSDCNITKHFKDAKPSHDLMARALSIKKCLFASIYPDYHIRTSVRWLPEKYDYCKTRTDFFSHKYQKYRSTGETHNLR